MRKLFQAMMLSHLLLLPDQIFSWANHYLFYYPALTALPEIKSAQEVSIESLETFVDKEKDSLKMVLAEIEKSAALKLSYYVPFPQNLSCDLSNKKTARECFLKTLRVNPTVPLGYFIQTAPGAQSFLPVARDKDISIFGEKDIQGRYFYREVKVGSKVRPLDVLATAGDEPDFGLDIHLFSDNGKSFGAEYGFGQQPFGDPKLYYSSQAPFHMGFYHESTLVMLFAGFLKKTLPEFRVHQFLSLARFAFKSGHDYWGYRFLGWALHYAGDITQPYHARVLPGLSSLSMIWINLKAMLGFDTDKKNAVENVSNRHIALENYHYALMRQALTEKNPTNRYFLALSDLSVDASIPGYSDDFFRHVLARESSARANRINEIITSASLVQSFKDSNSLENRNAKALAELDTELEKMMRTIGGQLRQFVRAGIAR